MKFNIYDYKNNPFEIDIGDKTIEFIFVSIISGDEKISIVFTDKTSSSYDSSNTRDINWNDGDYVVSKDRIDEWIDYPNQLNIKSGMISEKRFYKFSN